MTKLNIIEEITLNLAQPNINVIIHAKQNDKLSRQVQAKLINGVSAWTPPAGVETIVRYKKADGHVGFYDVDENDDPAVTFTGSTALITLAEQALTTPGPVLTEISMYTSEGEKLSSFHFAIMVEQSALTDEEIISTDYFNILSEQITAILNSIDAMVGIEATVTEIPLGQTSYVEVTGGTSAADPYVFNFYIERGHDGNGISSITLQSTSGRNKVYRIAFTDGTHFDFTVTDGNGITGIALLTTSENVKTYRISFSDGTHYDFAVTDGIDGASLNPRGTFDMSATYNKRDLVDYSRDSYVCMQNGTTGVIPTSSLYWMRIAQTVHVSNLEESYAAQAAADYTGDPPETGWQSSIPTVGGGNYLWKKIIINFTDSTSQTTYFNTRFGVNGEGSPGEDDPLMDGVADPGEATQYARQDHVHPSDTTRVPTTRTVNGQELSADISTRIIGNNIQVTTWEQITTTSDFKFRGTIPLQGVNSTMIPEVYFSEDDATSAKFSPVAESTTDAIYIYCKENKTSAPPTIPTVVAWR